MACAATVLGSSRSHANAARDESRRDTRVREMVDEHFAFIWRALRGMGVPVSSADDVTQEVFWIAAQKIDAIKIGSERAFLFSTARGVSANARRAILRSREQGDDELGRLHDEADDPEAHVEKTLARRHLERILAEMDEDLRTAFVLFELEELTSVEIAKVLAIPTGTVASRVRRAREAFGLAARKLEGLESIT